MNFSFRLVVLSLLVLALGCASDELKKSDNPEVVYNEGVRLLGKGRHLEANDYFSEVKKRFPQSKFYALAQLRTADNEFDQENYAEAAAAYGVFFDLYPTHADAAFALYRRAISFYKDAPEKIARDQTPAKQAVEAAKQFIAKFSSSPYLNEVKEILANSRLRLAEKEAYVARFYEKREAWSSALTRWMLVKDDYADLKTVAAASTLLDEMNQKLSFLQAKLEESKSSANN